MFPNPEPMQTPGVRSATDIDSEPAPVMLRLKDAHDAAAIAADVAHEAESGLRIRLALSAARRDPHDERSPAAPKSPGTWIVKSLPRPPLVAAMLQEPLDDELLANDSLGG